MSETGSGRRDPRRQQDLAYCMKAQLALGDDPRYTWLCDRSVIEAGKPRAWRPQLLTGLGRLLAERGREVMLALADQMCRRQPTTRQALALIREQRLESGSNRSLAFSAAMLEAAEHFLPGTPALTAEEIIAALDEVQAALLADLQTDK